MSAELEPRESHVEPLWDRIDRNRIKTAVFVAAFIGSVAVSCAALVAAAGAFVGIALVSPQGYDDFFRAYPYLVGAALALGGAGGSAYVWRRLTGPQRRLLTLFGAVRTETGACLPVKSALHDMAIAAGYEHAPPLWIITDCDRINAFAIGMSERSAVVGVTRGFVERLSADSQRAVFANLMARLRSGDTMWATAVSAVIGPVWALRAADLRRQEGNEDPIDTFVGSDGMRFGGERRGAQEGAGLLVAALAVVLTELLMAGHERAALSAAEKADAEGMLLLKDPEAMVRGIEDVLSANNTVPSAGEAYSMLFFCWAGFGYAPDDDPEMRRIGRLREVIGAAGA